MFEPLRKRDALDIVQRSDLCTGCGLCESLAGKKTIKVDLNERLGLYRPLKWSSLDKDISEKIAQICPGLNVAHERIGENFDSLWGPIQSIGISAAADAEVRHMGSSGGVLSALQIHLLESGKVDYILSTRVSAKDPFGTEISVCKTREDVLASAGSRYAPSAPLKSILTHLQQSGRFAFVGKPCDVAALRNLARIEPKVTEKIAYMLSFMCAGVPARQGTLDVVKYLGLSPDNITSFRYRGDGWPGFAKAIDCHGNSGTMSYEESWQKKLSPQIQWRCKFCPDGTGEHADITCADAWHLADDGKPDFSEHEGRSFFIARTLAGSELLSEAKNNGYLLDLGNSSTEDIEKTQFHQGYRKKTSSVRYFALCLMGFRFPKYNIGALLNASMKSSPLALIRAFGGTLARLRRKLMKSRI